MGITAAAAAVFLHLLLLLPFFYQVELTAHKKTEPGPEELRFSFSLSWFLSAVRFRWAYEDGKGTWTIFLFGQKLPLFSRKPKKKGGRSPKKDVRKKHVGTEQGTARRSPEKDIRQEHVDIEHIGIEHGAARRSPDAGLTKRDLLRLRFSQLLSFWHLLQTDPARRAVRTAKHSLWRLLRHLFPYALDGELAFGREDPCQTGYLLAALGMTMPLHQGRIRIAPDFEAETDYLDGNACARGRFLAGYVLIQLTRLYFAFRRITK